MKKKIFVVDDEEDIQNILEVNKMAAKTGFFQKISNYLEEVKKEFKKLSYPELPELLGYTYVTIATTFFFTIYIYVVDLILTFVVQSIYA